MEDYILKVKSYKNNGEIEFGTGIAIDTNLVITPSHVVIGERHSVIVEDQEINATIQNSNNHFTILKLDINSLKYATAFSDDEILDDESKWCVFGYISVSQVPHEITGVGFHVNTTNSGIENWNCILQNTLTGVKNNYSGLSGSPVISHNRIVGILQCQEVVEGKPIELKMASVSMFKDLLTPDVISINEYKEKFFIKANEHTHQQISKNKQIRKYIPDIYVEERHYKEMVRYFADPALFVQKSLCELLRYDWSVINDSFRKKDLPLIDFKRFENLSESDSFFDDIKELCHFIEEAVANIEIAEKNKEEVFYINQYSQKWTSFNNSIKWYLRDILDTLRMIPIKYLLLKKEAGQGKTNFLCDFTENFLLKKGYYVLYFNASSFSDNPFDYIIRFLTINGEYELSYSKKVLEAEYDQTKKPFIIVIDGLNENSNINNFGNTIKTFLEKCEEFSFIKVLMSTRSEFYDERFGELSTGLYQNKFSLIYMQNNDKKFNSRIFWGYLKFFDIDIVESTLSGITYKKLTKDVLLLRYFCEVNEHKKNLAMHDVFIYEVFEKYTDEKCSKYSKVKDGVDPDVLRLLIDKIILQMINNNNYTSITIEEFTKDETQLLNELLENEVIFKGEAFIKGGIVPKQVVTIGFTFDEYRDYCITNYIITNYDEEALLEFMYQIEQEKTPICEGVQKYLFYLSHTKYKAELKVAVEKTAFYEKLYWRHIWSIDEQYIDQNDLLLIENQVFCNTHYMELVINKMIHRYDCNYYKKINIKRLMEIFDKLEVSSPEQYDFIICRFPYIDDSDPWHYGLKKDAIFRLDYIIQKLHQDITDDILIEHSIELMRFTIYILQNDQFRICELWEHFYRYSKEKAYELLSEMNAHHSRSIKENTASIISSILGSNSDDNLQVLLDNNSCYKNNTTSFRDYFTKLIKDLEKYNEDL